MLSRKGLAIAGEPMSDFFHPKLQAVEALASYRLRTTWSTGEVLDVDVESVLRGTTALTKLLEPRVFAEAHLAEWGQGIEWFDVELGADNVYAWGISRRMVSYYRTAHKSIPRAIWLACLGWEATMPKPKTLPLALPTAREYALAHA